MTEPATPPTAGRLVGRHDLARNVVEVHDYGRFPDTLTHAHDTNVDVKFVAPNGRVYAVRLEGNDLRVSSTEGGIYVRPKADNLVIVTNLTYFERDTERMLEG